MADYIHHDDDVARGANSALGIILAVLLVLALIVGAWWLFFRGDVDDDQPTINQDIELEEDSGETTTGP